MPAKEKSAATKKAPDARRKPAAMKSTDAHRKPYAKTANDTHRKPYAKKATERKPYAKKATDTHRKPYAKKAIDASATKGSSESEAEPSAKKAKFIPKDHKEQRELKVQRKIAANPNFTLVQDLKALWELVRQKRLSSAERAPTIKQMLELSRGKMKDHDSARVIQCLIRYGKPEQREEIFQELKDHVIELAKSRYSRFIVPKMLQYGVKAHRDFIIHSFYGKVRQLIRQKIAGEILASAYVDYANAAQRSALVEEFYGPKFSLFKTEQKRDLKTICDATPEKKLFFLKHLKETIAPLLEKDFCRQHHILHRAIAEYLELAEGKDFVEMVGLVRDHVVEMLHTKDGARIACLCLKHSAAKDRKNMIKTFKPYVEKICNEEHGYIVLIAAFDMIDDTVLMKKMIISEMAEHSFEIAANPNGRKVLLYLASHRSKRHFLPEMIRQLDEYLDNEHSKKDPDARYQELLSASSPTLLNLVAEHAAELCREGSSSLLVSEILLNCQGDKSGAFEAVAKQSITLEEPLIEHECGHRMLKVVIKKEPESENSFAEHLAQLLVNSETDLIELGKKNRCAFILLSLLESENRAGQVQALQNHLQSLAVDLASANADEFSAGTKLLLAYLTQESPPKKRVTRSKAKSQ